MSLDIFLTADPHLGHANVLRHNAATRLFSCIEEHDTFFIDHWNADVTRKDEVYIVGDFAWRDHRQYLNQLKGKKILIRGSHDKMSKLDYDQFTAVHDIKILNVNKRMITLLHWAMTSWPSSHYGMYHAHGHSHCRLPEFPDMLRGDVGVDGTGMRLWPLEAYMAKMAAREAAWHERMRNRVDAVAGELPDHVIINARNNKQWLEAYQKVPSQSLEPRRLAGGDDTEVPVDRADRELPACVLPVPGQAVSRTE